MISKATISFIQSLKQKKYRQKYNKFLLEGEKLIIEGLEEGRISFDTIYCLADKALLLESFDTAYNIIDSRTMSKLSGMKTPPGLIAIANIPEKQGVESLDFSGLTLYLDDIKDPGNMGTIIRTAEWFGVKSIIASENSVEFYNPKVVQASMGSIARIKLINANVDDLPAHIDLCAAVLDGTNFNEFKASKDLILVIGSESHGVREKVLQRAKHKITIPRDPYSKAESLNAAIACSILLSHLKN